MHLTDDWIFNPATQAVFAVLARAGRQALFVGGCVRNALMGLPAHDIDIATNARPDEVCALMRHAGLGVIETGLDHGTVTVMSNGIAHEVTTFRKDVASDGRHAIVAFCDDPAVDAARRDFTMNALYATSAGQVVDPLGGMADVLTGHVRFVGEPAARIQEDYLRILRFFRFHACYGNPDLGIDAPALAACAAYAEGLAGLSRERVGHEMRKLLSALDPASSVAAMQQAGILARVLPGGDGRFLAVLGHVEKGFPPDWRRRLLVMGGDDPHDLWRLSRAERRDLAAMRAALSEDYTPMAYGHLLGVEPGANVVLARAALLGQMPPENWHAMVQAGADTPFPVKAADLPHYQGAALGACLKGLKQAWLSSNLTLDRTALLKLAGG